MIVAFTFPFAFQGFLMLFDEFYFHEKRGLGLWERIGHPLDTLSVLIPLLYLIQASPENFSLPVYITLATLSCFFVTKDEWVHTRESSAGENALHALLFILHPVLFFCAYQLAQSPEGVLPLQIQIGIVTSFGAYQIARWRPWRLHTSYYTQQSIAQAAQLETHVYETLGDKWYTAKNDPVALLRAESRARLPWITQTLNHHFQAYSSSKTLLDLGCGAGILANHLARELPATQWRITGLDSAAPALEIARQFKPKENDACVVDYLQGDAHQLPFPDQSFDCVCAMDFLEHVEDKERILQEIRRVLKPQGLFFFHTFTTGALSRFLVIDIVEAFIPNTPKGLHIERLFISPQKLQEKLAPLGLKIRELRALNPRITLSALMHLIFRREVPDSFQFQIDTPQKISAGYIGFAHRDS